MRLLCLFVALTAGLSLLYGIQYYAGGPLRLAVTSEIHDLMLSPDGSLVAAGTQDGIVRLWDTANDWMMRTLSGHTGPVVSVAFAPDGSTLFSASHDGTVRLWDVSTVLNAGVLSDQVERELDARGGPLNDLALAADGSILATIGEDGVIRVWDAETGQVIQSIGPNEKTKLAVALSSEGSLAAAGDGQNIPIWDARTGELLHMLEGHWEDEEVQKDWLGHEKEVTALAFSPDGLYLASGSAEGTSLIWDVEKGKVAWKTKGHLGAVSDIEFDATGKYALSGGRDNYLRRWWVPGGKYAGIFKGHLGPVTSVAFGSEADTVLSGGADGSVRLWETVNEKAIRVEWTRNGFQPVWGKVLSGWMLISGLLGMVCLWGLWRIRTWSYLLTLALFLIGPLFVLGLPLLEILPSVLEIIYTSPWFALVLLVLGGLLILGGMVCNVLVLDDLYRSRGLVHAVAVWIFTPYAFIWGWIEADELRFRKTMPIWTGNWAGLILVTFILRTVVRRIGTAVTGGLLPGIEPQIAWPLVVLLAWYAFLVICLLQDAVAIPYQAPDATSLAEQLMAARRSQRLRHGLSVLATWLFVFVLLFSVLRRFGLDVAFMRKWLPFIMGGAGITMFISAMAIVLATVLALVGALARLSNNPLANGISGFYISLIRGTPLLVQIFIWYLALPQLGLVLEPKLAGILALGVNYGAYMTEVFRAGIQAIGIGQYEAANALGMSSGQTLRRIVLPQAFRIVIPPIGNEFIAMMKDSALVSMITVQELTFRAQKIGRQNFRNLETFLIAAAFYWLLTIIFQFFQGNLETYMARGERR